MAYKELEQMDLAELGKLFPIVLTAYDPAWPQLFNEEKARIECALKDIVFRIRHIGSTSVPGLAAKPTIDILLEVAENSDPEKIKEVFRSMGYRLSPQPEKPPPQLMFMKGYAAHGYEGQAYHVHVRYPGDWDEPYFRDYLAAHAEIAREYVLLKQRLKRKYEHDREAYTQAKTEFIKDITAHARKEAGKQIKDNETL